MTEKIDVFAKARETRRQTRAAARSMADLARTLVLAGLGAAALARDETQQLATRLVERGAEARHEARKMAEDLAGRAQVEGTHVQGRVEHQVEGVLGRMNIPSRDDMAALNAKIAVLSAKIDAMQGNAAPDSPGAAIDPSAQI